MVLYIDLGILGEDSTATCTFVTIMKTTQRALVGAILLLLGVADLALVSSFLVNCGGRALISYSYENWISMVPGLF
jgi:hypothetical protein